MKKFTGLVVILAVLILGGYYVMGLVTERTLKKDVNMINQSSGLHVEIQEYHRGWFSSTAKFNWRLHIPERIVKNKDGQSTTTPAQDYAIDMPLTIYHGPIIFADSGVQLGLGYAYTDLTLPQTYAEQFSAVFTPESTKPKMDVSILVNYLNRSRLRINLPQFKLIAKEGNGQFEWFGMTNDLTVSSNLNSIEGDLTIDGMSFLKDDVKGTVGKIYSEYDLHQTKEGLYLGDANLSFPSLVVMDKNQKVFELEQFDVHTSSDIDGGLFSSDFKTSLDKIIANGKTYGPGLLKVSIKNLDAQVLSQINMQVNKMQQGTEQERQQALMNMLPELPKLFSKGAEFKISEASFVVPEGKIEGDLLVALPKGDITNPFELIQKVVGEAKVKIPTIVVKNLMLASAKQQLSQPSLQQAMVDQMKNDNKVPDAVAAAKPVDPQAAATKDDNVAPATATAIPAPAKPATPQEIEQKAKAQADERLAGLIHAGLLVQKGDDYVIEFKLAEGQLSVNGQPYNSAMTKF